MLLYVNEVIIMDGLSSEECEDIITSLMGRFNVSRQEAIKLFLDS